MVGVEDNCILIEEVLHPLEKFIGFTKRLSKTNESFQGFIGSVGSQRGEGSMVGKPRVRPPPGKTRPSQGAQGWSTEASPRFQSQAPGAKSRSKAMSLGILASLQGLAPRLDFKLRP